MQWIKDTLELLPFVKFDRYTEDKIDNLIEVYGWIDRKDSYKDFVVLEFNLKTKQVYCVATSFAKYSKRISKILKEPHVDCIPINKL